MADASDPHPLTPAEEPAPDLHFASADDVLSGRTAPAELVAAEEALRVAGEDPEVVSELRFEGLVDRWPWAVLCGVEEAVAALDGREVEVLAVPEGTVVYPDEPVLQVAGRYSEIGVIGTALVGMLAQATGAATTAARLRRAAGGRPVYPIGLSEVHPAIVPVLERAAYVGGWESALTRGGADLTGAEVTVLAGPELTLLLGERDAWGAFDRVADPSVPRVVTLGVVENDRATAIAAVGQLRERLSAVRIEAPLAGGGLVHLAREIRWELDAIGRSDVGIIVAGDLGEGDLEALHRHVDGFGLGRALAAASPARFSLDLVEVDGEARSPRGALSGRKTLWRCESCGNRGIAPARVPREPCPRCSGRLGSLLVRRLRWGSPERPAPAVSTIRARALKESSEAPHPS